MQIIILGGGFGGVSAALALTKKKLPGVKIRLISDRPHLEYHPALYRIVTGRSPLEVCVPLREIFDGRAVEILEDRINRIDLKAQTLTGVSGSRYRYDFLIVAAGSETSYFGISGLPEFSFGFKSIAEALRLKNHLHQLFEECANGTGADQVCGSHIVIVGGGASGVELAGELAAYGRKLAVRHRLDPTLVVIDLIEAAPRLLPSLPPGVAAQVKARLHALGINIFLNRTLLREEVEAIQFPDMIIKTKTVIWTAGVKNNALLAGVSGWQFDKKGRVLVDEYLHPPGFRNVFVIGDGAATAYAGMAQTAVADGVYAASAIAAALESKTPSARRPKPPRYAIPVGPLWAAVLIGPFTVYGFSGWCLRRLADFRYFLSILPPRKAWLAFRSGKILSESCPVCNPRGQTEN